MRMFIFVYLIELDLNILHSDRLKYFADSEVEGLRKTILNDLFESVQTAKPKASRSDSSEYYFVCKGFIGTDRPHSVKPDKSSNES